MVEVVGGGGLITQLCPTALGSSLLDTVNCMNVDDGDSCVDAFVL